MDPPPGRLPGGHLFGALAALSVAQQPGQIHVPALRGARQGGGLKTVEPSSGGTLNALAWALGGSNPPRPSVHRLGRGLQGYLIPFAPHAFVPERQQLSREPPSPLAFLTISTHFTATP